MPKIECDECGELVECMEFNGKYYCDECNSKTFEKIDKNMKVKGIKIDDML